MYSPISSGSQVPDATSFSRVGHDLPGRRRGRSEATSEEHATLGARVSQETPATTQGTLMERASNAFQQGREHVASFFTRTSEGRSTTHHVDLQGSREVGFETDEEDEDLESSQTRNRAAAPRIADETWTSFSTTLLDKLTTTRDERIQDLKPQDQMIHENVAEGEGSYRTHWITPKPTPSQRAKIAVVQVLAEVGIALITIAAIVESVARYTLYCLAYPILATELLDSSNLNQRAFLSACSERLDEGAQRSAETALLGLEYLCKNINYATDLTLDGFNRTAFLRGSYPRSMMFIRPITDNNTRMLSTRLSMIEDRLTCEGESYGAPYGAPFDATSTMRRLQAVEAQLAQRQGSSRSHSSHRRAPEGSPPSAPFGHSPLPSHAPISAAPQWPTDYARTAEVARLEAAGRRRAHAEDNSQVRVSGGQMTEVDLSHG